MSELAVQTFLRREGTVQDLCEKFAINLRHHPTLPIALYNYDQIRSSKYIPIVRDCRGLCLEDSTWNVVAQGFRRFYNWGESPQEMECFNWLDFFPYEKVDGSYINLFCYKNAWLMSTRQSFGQDEMGQSGENWEQAVCRALRIDNLQRLHKEDLDKETNYVCELTTPHNQVVKFHNRYTMHLLTRFKGGVEIPIEFCRTPILPHLFNQVEPWLACGNAQERLERVQNEIENRAEEDPCFEGFVIRDCNGIRFKLKSKSYLLRHHLRGNNGINLTKHSTFVRPVLNGEKSEFLLGNPDCTKMFEETERIVQDALTNLCQVYYKSPGPHGSQKEFAQYVIPRTSLSAFCFRARKLGREPVELARENPELLSKILFGDKD